MDRSGRLYATTEQPHTQLYLWYNGSTIKHNYTYDNPTGSFAVFIDHNDIIYLDDANTNRIIRWYQNETRSIISKYWTKSYGLFVDIENRVYSSDFYGGKIQRKGLYDSSVWEDVLYNIQISDQLCWNLRQQGIYVDKDINLYVSNTDRSSICMFNLINRTFKVIVRSDQLILNHLFQKPTHVILDEKKTIYIVDNGNNRIISVSPDHTDIRCALFCDAFETNVSTSKPTYIFLDSVGNFYVTDTIKNRIIQLTLETSTNGKFYFPFLYEILCFSR